MLDTLANPKVSLDKLEQHASAWTRLQTTQWCVKP